MQLYSELITKNSPQLRLFYFEPVNIDTYMQCVQQLQTWMKLHESHSNIQFDSVTMMVQTFYMKKVSLHLFELKKQGTVDICCLKIKFIDFITKITLYKFPEAYDLFGWNKYRRQCWLRSKSIRILRHHWRKKFTLIN